MLVYGSAVTATHLAGRLKGGDFVDEKQQTPDLAKVGPLLQSNQGFQADAVSGAMRAGQQVQSLQWGSMWQELTSSSAQAVSSHSQGLVNSIGKSLSENNNSTVQNQRLHSIADAFPASSDEAKSWLNNTMNQFSQGYSYDKKHEESIRGVLAATASGAISGSKAISMLEDDYGVKAKASGEVGVTGRTEDANSDSKTHGQSDVSQFVKGINRSESQKAAFAKSFAENLSNSSSETDTHTWSGTAVNSKAEDVRDALTTQDQYSKMAQNAATFGLTGSQNLSVAAGNILDDDKASAQLNNNLQSLLQSDSSGQFKSQYQSAYNKFMSDAYTGGDHARSQVMAALQTMTNPLSYSDEDRMQNGVEGVMRAMTTALGVSGFGPTPGNESKNQSLTTATGPTDPSLSDITPIGGVAFNNPSAPPAEIGEAGARGKYQTYSGEVTAAGNATANSQSRAEAVRLAEQYNAEQRNDNGLEGNNAAYTSGAATNIWDNLKNANDYATGGAMAYAGGVAKELEKWSDGLANFDDPQKLQNFRDYRAQQLEDAYGDSALGKLGQAFRNGSDAIGGYVSDLVAGDKPEAMSYTEYGSYLSDAAISAVTFGGPENAGQYWDHLDDKIYDNYYQQAKEEWGWSDASAQYHAATMTSNIGQMISSGASRIAEIGGYGSDAFNSRIYDENMTEAYNAMKLEAAPKVFDEESGQMIPDKNSYTTREVDGREVISLNNKTLDEFIDNKADDIHMAGYTGQWADNYSSQFERIDSLLNPSK